MKEEFVNYFCNSIYSFHIVFFSSFLSFPSEFWAHELSHLEGDTCLDERLALIRNFLLYQLLIFQKCQLLIQIASRIWCQGTSCFQVFCLLVKQNCCFKAALTWEKDAKVGPNVSCLQGIPFPYFGGIDWLTRLILIQLIAQGHNFSAWFPELVTHWVSP